MKNMNKNYLQVHHKTPSVFLNHPPGNHAVSSTNAGTRSVTIGSKYVSLRRSKVDNTPTWTYHPDDTEQFRKAPC